MATAVQDNTDHIAFLNPNWQLWAKLSACMPQRQYRINAQLLKMPRPHTSTSAKHGQVRFHCGQYKEWMWKRRRIILPAARRTMESKGSDKGQDILTLLRLSPHTATNASPGCQSASHERDGGWASWNAVELTYFLSSFVVAVVLNVVKRLLPTDCDSKHRGTV